MLLFFFPLIIFTVGGLTFFLVHYKKLVKYFMEDCRKVSLLAILLESLEKGFSRSSSAPSTPSFSKTCSRRRSHSELLRPPTSA